MNRTTLLIALALASVVFAAFKPLLSSAGPEDNPFLTPSTLPYHAPPFDRIKDSHYQPAMREGMRQHLAEVAAIADNPEAATFENTIVALERTGALLDRVTKVLWQMAESNTNPTLQKIKGEEAPKLAAHRDAIFLDPKLWRRVEAIYAKRDALGLQGEDRQLLERTYRGFVRAGARLSAADQATLRKLNQEEAKLQTDFAKMVLADTNESAVVVSSKAELEGLPEGDVAAAAEAARERGLKGKWVITLRNTTRQPGLTYLKNRALRQRLLQASEQRGKHGGSNDTRALVLRLARLRAQKAGLLGFANWATYRVDDQMAKTPQAVQKLLTDLVPPATAKARGEAERLQQMARSEGADSPVTAADWAYYAEKVRKAEYDLDEEQIRPYLDVDRVLRDGVFFAANKLYGLTFKERKDLPVYHPDVRTFEVIDADGSPLALLYIDFFDRPSKSGGAWMDNFVDQCGLTGDRAVIVNVCNFTRPAAGQPALISWDDTETLFHEFGHSLHGMLSKAKYRSLGGTNVPRDFVELPSQFNEHWALEPTVLARYARHYKSGEPMPAVLIDKIQKAHKFNQGYDTTEYLGAALLDLAWHTLTAGDAPKDVESFEKAALERFGVGLGQVPPRYRTTYFSHIWKGDYSAAYYAYMWSEVLDHDAYYWFKEHGGMTRANGDRFRQMILSRGETEDVSTLFRAFRGRDPIVEPLLIERGLK